MRFELIDRVIERTPTRVVALKQITMSEEYLADHFPSFPVLPGVLMLEALVQAARRLTPETSVPMVLGRVRALKYGALVRPGDSLRIEVDRVPGDEDRHDFKGKALLIAADGDGRQTKTAASGRFELRPLRPGLAVAG